MQVMTFKIVDDDDAAHDDNEQIEGPVTKLEIKNAIKDMRNGKRAAIDNITVEMIKVVTDTTVGDSLDIFRLIWEEERIPENWRTGVKWLHRVITYGVARASVIF